MGDLRLHIKQAIQYNIVGDPIIYNGSNPNNLQPVVNGVLAPDRQWPNFGSYIDVTDFVSDLTTLQLVWTEERDPSGNATTAGQTQNKKSTSGQLTFEAEAYVLLKKWLVNDISAPLNMVSVKIEDVSCGKVYEDYVIKAIDLRWCEEEDNVNLCVFDVTLKQEDDPLTCIQRTEVADNWQGWFSDGPFKKHPRFSYCNEQRPNGMMVMLWWVIAAALGPMLPFIMFIVAIINIVIGIVNMIIKAVNIIVGIVGGNTLDEIDTKKNNIPYIDFDGVFLSMANYYIESAGCGREHPAPLVRDYIYNVCAKCGIHVDEFTCPVFFAKDWQIETSSRGVITTRNYHYNACYFNAPVQRGVRRFETIGIFNNPNDHEYFLYDNRPLLNLDQFLDELKVLYNHEWRIAYNNGKPTLYFQRKDFFIQGNYLLDFTTGADRMKLLQGICFEWNSVKYPLFCDGIYQHDPIDTCGNDALKVMNSVVPFDKTGMNPMFKDHELKQSNYGATRFRLDGVDIDYIYDAFQVVTNSAFMVPMVQFFMFDVVAPFIDQYCDYALLMKDETCRYPKIIIWDGNRYENARAIANKGGWPQVGVLARPMPTPNQKYNTQDWNILHKPLTKVRGSSLTIPAAPDGVYFVSDILGVYQIERPATVINYPMFFDEQFQDTLWDWFHWIDDPVLNPKMNQRWTAILELCCETLNTLGVFGGQNIALSSKVKLPLQYYQDGRVTEITVNYNTDPPLGQHIILKGNV